MTAIVNPAVVKKDPVDLGLIGTLASLSPHPFTDARHPFFELSHRQVDLWLCGNPAILAKP
jgi:hypothetical protein